MKRTYLKKQSNNPKAIFKKKLDRAFQDFFRELCFDFGIGSEVSGISMEVCHHAHEKANCAALSYDERNFIPITHREHSQHHNAGDPKIMFIIGEKRGQAWWDELDKIKKAAREDRSIRTMKWYREKAEYLEMLKDRRAELVANYRRYGYFALNENVIG